MPAATVLTVISFFFRFSMNFLFFLPLNAMSNSCRAFETVCNRKHQTTFNKYFPVKRFHDQFPYSNENCKHAICIIYWSEGECRYSLRNYKINVCLHVVLSQSYTAHDPIIKDHFHTGHSLQGSLSCLLH